MLTQKVRAEFIGRGKYQILPESTGVDALLNGEVTAVSIQPASLNPQQLASRYAITMQARVELRDMRENKVLWENPGILFRQEYEATDQPQQHRSGGILPAGHQRPRTHQLRVRADHRQRHPRSLLVACTEPGRRSQTNRRRRC